ncbi:MAG: peroxidase-related enzyme [Desulfobacterales bacterium]
MTWIKTILPEEATGDLKNIYQKTQSPHGTVDNVYISKSLRPQTILGHDTLYKSVLHHPDNVLPTWFLELVATYTSLLNRCDYAFTHHGSNFRTLLGNEEQADKIMVALDNGDPASVFSGKELEFLRYTRILTESPADITEAHIQAMRDAGADDGEILEVNQTCACFNYSNRSLSGLGVEIGSDRVGYY